MIDESVEDRALAAIGVVHLGERQPGGSGDVGEGRAAPAELGGDPHHPGEEFRAFVCFLAHAALRQWVPKE